MAIARQRRASSALRFFGGGPGGAVLILVGLVLALAAGLLVMNMTRQAQAAATQGVRQTYVVMAVQDVPEFTPIPPSAVAVKAFPAAFAPPGAASTVDDVVGKFATTRLTRDQVVLSSQVSESRAIQGASAAAAIPAGKVAYWMAIPDLVSQAGGLRPGDHVDVLLSISVLGPNNQAKGLTTQTVLQDVEVFSVGSADTAAQQAPSSQIIGQVPGAGIQARPGARFMSVLLDPQQAVIAKFIKDSGGAVDVVLRSRETTGPTNTESVSADTLVERLGFRGSERWSVGK
jgi:pilus assembly protein CpaB